MLKYITTFAFGIHPNKTPIIKAYRFSEELKYTEGKGRIYAQFSLFLYDDKLKSVFIYYLLKLVFINSSREYPKIFKQLGVTSVIIPRLLISICNSLDTHFFHL